MECSVFSLAGAKGLPLTCLVRSKEKASNAGADLGGGVLWMKLRLESLFVNEVPSPKSLANEPILISTLQFWMKEREWAPTGFRKRAMILVSLVP